jgi:type VI secretion system secreted protein VgrG
VAATRSTLPAPDAPGDRRRPLREQDHGGTAAALHSLRQLRDDRVATWVQRSISSRSRTMAMLQMMELVSPLGDDLLFKQMSGEESLGRLFEYRVDLLSPKADIKADQLLGQAMTVKLEQSDGEPRFFNGYVMRFSAGAYNGRYYSYQAILRPWTWILTRKTDCRIFQKMTVPAIIKKIFEDYPDLVAFDDKLRATYREWEYCVQYRESDFNFISRLMEHEGIYYYFEHLETEHKLVLVDLFSAHKETPNFGSLPYYHESVRTRPGAEFIHRWQHAVEMRSGEVETWDYDFKAPPKPVRAKKPNVKEPALSAAQVFDYPGGYVDVPEGEQYAGIRLEELQTGYEAAGASTNARTVRVGALLNVTNHPTYKGQYLVTRASYQMSLGVYESAGEDGASFGCSFSVVPAKQQYRPRRSTPKPIVQGPQTATVVGPDGEEIYVDEFGRVKVKFHWDRHEPKDGKEENRSCWIRVSHPWAGKKWGMIAIPRVQQEVIVDFLEGDPDQPIITGRVYNGDQMPPYDLPANATQTGIKTRSSKGGDPQAFNEIRFEDKKGSEMLTIHAEKDMSSHVENDDSTVVQRDQTLTVQRDQTTIVQRDQNLTVTRNRTSQVNNNESHVVKVDQKINVVGNQDIKVDGNHNTTVAGTYELTATGVATTVFSAARKDVVKGNDDHKVNGNLTTSADGTITLSSGAAIVLSAPHIEEHVSGSSSKIIGVPSGPLKMMAAKIQSMSSGDIDLLASGNINMVCNESNTTVMGSNSSGYIGCASDTMLAIARSSAMALSMECFVGVAITNKLALEMENVAGARMNTTAGPNLEMISLKNFVPGGGGGGPGALSAGRSAMAALGTVAGIALGAKSFGAGFGEMSDQYALAKQQLQDAARDADDAGFPGLAARLNGLAGSGKVTAAWVFGGVGAVVKAPGDLAIQAMTGGLSDVVGLTGPDAPPEPPKTYEQRRDDDAAGSIDVPQAVDDEPTPPSSGAGSGGGDDGTGGAGGSG